MCKLCATCRRLVHLYLLLSLGHVGQSLIWAVSRTACAQLMSSSLLVPYSPEDFGTCMQPLRETLMESGHPGVSSALVTDQNDHRHSSLEPR